MRGHIRDEFDGRRAAQDAGRDAAAKRRVGWRDAHDCTKLATTRSAASARP